MSDQDDAAENSGDVSDSLNELRQNIDKVDNQLISLLNQRARLALDVGKVKAKTSQKMYVPERERALLNRLMAENPGPLPSAGLKLIYKEIISACLALESPLKISFLGPEGTFTHAATKRHFGLSAQLLPKQTIAEVFNDVERGRSEYGVVPIENSTEGVVNHTLDAFMNSELCICAEVLLGVSHHILTATGEAEGITKVYSHPQALAQCRGWLERYLPGVPLIDVSSTARAAQLASEDTGAAAVASDFAASIHGLRIAHEQVEDLQGNMTRFLVVGTQPSSVTGEDRTSIMFALKDAPGVLFDALSPFARTGINLSRIESRPSRQRAWEYLFFIDLVGHIEHEALVAAVDELRERCVFIKVLGSYPRGVLEERAPRAVE